MRKKFNTAFMLFQVWWNRKMLHIEDRYGMARTAWVGRWLWYKAVWLATLPIKWKIDRKLKGESDGKEEGRAGGV